MLPFYFMQECKFQVLPQKVTSFREHNSLNKFPEFKTCVGIQESTGGKEFVEMKVPPCGVLSFKSLRKSGGRLEVLFTNSN